jgi:hypothetical protein
MCIPILEALLNVPELGLIRKSSSATAVLRRYFIRADDFKHFGVPPTGSTS